MPAPLSARQNQLLAALTAACYRHHSVEQQLCRWLLLTLDRVGSREQIMTQELVASSLGVRRESVAAAAGKLQHSGLIRYRRGHIAVLDRSGLETRACECYAVVKKEQGRLLPGAHRVGASPRLAGYAAAGSQTRGSE